MAERIALSPAESRAQRLALMTQVTVETLEGEGIDYAIDRFGMFVVAEGGAVLGGDLDHPATDREALSFANRVVLPTIPKAMPSREVVSLPSL